MEPQDTTVLLGDPVVLTCKVNPRILQPRITWYNDDVEVTWSTKTDCTGELDMIVVLCIITIHYGIVFV